MSQFQHPEGLSVTREEDRRVDRAIVGLLLAASSPGPWSEAELVRELGPDGTATLDSISRLHRAGVIHRCGEFVFATRAATAMNEMFG